MNTIQTIRPSSGELLEVYDLHSQSEVEDRLAASWVAFESWRQRPMESRAQMLLALAQVLEDGSERWALRMAEEMGKPLAQGHSEVSKSAWVCRHYAEHAAEMIAPQTLSLATGPYRPKHSSVVFSPLGPLLAIMPWNFPFWQVLRCAAPSLAAGNVVVLKHAPNVAGCALDLEEIFLSAGFPRGVFTTLLVDEETTGELIADPRIRAVTLTGSTTAGRAVAARAGAALKKCVLELGGSDPCVILDDADLELAATACVESRLINSGQSCIAAKRWIVTSSRVESFTRRTKELLRSKHVGDPLDPSTDIGPLARHDLQQSLHRQVVASLEAGARCALGGELPRGEGYYYPITLLTEVTPSMVAGKEELFGPVASILVARDEAQALAWANATSYGLGASIFTADEERGRSLAATNMEAGCCFVNDFVRSDPRLPFGGIKESGFGRELGTFGIQEFVNVKSLVVA
ncbi:MAG: NAD-dependent succinate-semialdehyde dehydrogenase [Acidobacteriota bacterium]